MKTVGITGASGFIGRVLSNELMLKNFSLQYITCDLSEIDQVRDFFRTHQIPDVVIHLAGRFSGSEDVLYRDNFLATKNLLDVVTAKAGVHFIFASSGAVYGNSGHGPASEATPCNPNTQNGLLNLLCENLVNYHATSIGMGITTFRLPSIYGPGNSKGIIYNWCQSILNGDPLLIEGDGSQIRSFLDVRDVCGAVFLAAEREIYGTYNLASSDHYNITALAALFKQFFDVPISHVAGSNKLESMLLDSSAYRNASFWNCKHSLHDYLSEQKMVLEKLV